MNISILAKTLNFLVVATLAAGAAMAETTAANQDDQKQLSQSQDQNDKDLPDDDTMVDED